MLLQPSLPDEEFGNYEVSIPQAVGAVATNKLIKYCAGKIVGFNTASGRCCCNQRGENYEQEIKSVSIPQAVGAVATN